MSLNAHTTAMRNAEIIEASLSNPIIISVVSVA